MLAKRRVHKRWTKKDEQVVIKYIKKEFTNLQKAFSLASLELKRSKYSVAKRWYGKLRNEKSIFTMNQGRKVISNTKVVR